ncbi:efflux RND transporter periplasmic adaptor subunit [Noviherbaspirillum aridicola]|uniref:RND transporter n=1 Tax=Noviherbaspirillum aridicola TaxID=2849687 RepID=A0ABQ4Q077_9BURK|nr:efflux RND transporter periplasmic adaptor subunit [Noviherbaspirillum aridicola]GIZ50534.1 RND transporter [Noviherbaspirillum aridicola]
MDSRLEPVHIARSSATPRRQPARLRKLLKLLAAAAAIGLILWFMLAPEPLPVELATVSEGPMQVSIDHEGQVRAHDRYVLAAPVAAEVQRIALDEGDTVSKGQTLATLSLLPIDPRQQQEAQARLDGARALAQEASLRARKAEADLQLAATERARVEKLIVNNFISVQALDRALAAEASARAEREAARAREAAARADIRAAESALLASRATATGARPQLTLSSPVDGHVLKIHEKSARTVAAGTPLLTIGDPGRYEIVVDVLSTDAVRITPGAPVLIEGWGGEEVLRASVRHVEPVAFTKISALGVEEQRVNVIADPVGSLGRLGDGYRVEARIVTWAEDKVRKVPGSSLFRDGDSWRLFVVEDGRAMEREVRVGQRNQDEAQILSDLAPGTRVIRYPNNQMRDGMRVTGTGTR